MECATFGKPCVMMTCCRVHGLPTSGLTRTLGPPQYFSEALEARIMVNCGNQSHTPSACLWGIIVS